MAYVNEPDIAKHDAMAPCKPTAPEAEKFSLQGIIMWAANQTGCPPEIAFKIVADKIELQEAIIWARNLSHDDKFALKAVAYHEDEYKDMEPLQILRHFNDKSTTKYEDILRVLELAGGQEWQ